MVWARRSAMLSHGTCVATTCALCGRLRFASKLLKLGDNAIEFFDQLAFARLAEGGDE